MSDHTQITLPPGSGYQSAIYKGKPILRPTSNTSTERTIKEGDPKKFPPKIIAANQTIPMQQK